MLVRRTVWEQTGGFDEGYFMYAEEVEWCWRIWRAGWTIWQVPAAQIVHYGGQSTRQLPDTMFIELWRARLRFFRQHYGAGFGVAAHVLLRLGMGWRLLSLTQAVRRGEITPAVAAGRRAAAQAIKHL